MEYIHYMTLNINYWQSFCESSITEVPHKVRVESSHYSLQLDCHNSVGKKSVEANKKLKYLRQVEWAWY